MTFSLKSLFYPSSKLFRSDARKYPLPPAAPCNFTMQRSLISALDLIVAGIFNFDSNISFSLRFLSASHLKMSLLPKKGTSIFSISSELKDEMRVTVRDKDTFQFIQSFLEI